MIIAGPDLGRRIDVDSEPIDIGRADDATLRVESDAVSRRHASIQRFGDRVLIQDLGSTNGTYVNNERVRTKELREGDQVRVGKVVLKYTESAIEAEYHEQIFNLASVDSLTGAYNKRYFSEIFERLVAEAHGERQALSLVIFDIDHFKSINDTHGHGVGDTVLKRVGEVVAGQVRSRDVFCRVGGEEFTLLLPQSSLAVAQGAAELLRGAIELTDFHAKDVRISVTASLGVGELDAGEVPAAFYERVDGRLYQAKRAGRNRVF